MRIDGLYFDDKQRKEMLQEICSKLSGNSDKWEIISLITKAMAGSAGLGVGGSPSATFKTENDNYTVSANVCCGGYAEIKVWLTPHITYILE